ncbi:MAG: hypothetical protein IKG93_05480, partial [Clostridiales bacterium]|nr:hypothetical protein [Clostridiales bacterium]
MYHYYNSFRLCPQVKLISKKLSSIFTSRTLQTVDTLHTKSTALLLKGYKVYKTDGTVEELYNPSDLPVSNEISYMEEPFVTAEILTPKEFVGNIMEICQNRRGIYIDMKYL